MSLPVEGLRLAIRTDNVCQLQLVSFAGWELLLFLRRTIEIGASKAAIVHALPLHL